MTQRFVIVNADDFGQSPGVNQGIFRAHEEGILTSTSLMTRWPAAADAGIYARRTPELSVGLHIDLGGSVYRDGEWATLYEVVDARNAKAVSSELTRKLKEFERVGRAPTHLDSHQHLHRTEPRLTLVRDAGEHLRIPVRHLTPQGSRLLEVH